MQCVAPYITAAVPSPSIPALLKSFMHICNNDIGASDEEEEDGIDLCNCEFSLAYGTHAWLLDSAIVGDRGLGL